MMSMVRRLWALTLGALALLAGGAAYAAQPEPWGINFQQSATNIMAQITWFDWYTLIIITVITLFVLALLFYVMVRFNQRTNKEPSKTSHNTMLEVVWTVVPVLILVAIAFPSFRLLYNETTIPTPELTVKAIGGQWYWNYEYMDEPLAAIRMTSSMLTDEQRAQRMQEYNLTEAEVPRLLATNNALAVPVGKVVHMLVTSLDVNHAVAMPAFGIKSDAIQGRNNEVWFRAESEGVFYGQCSELCGRLHAFMPIEIHVLSEEKFSEWTEIAKTSMRDASAQLVTWQAEGREDAVAALSAQ